MTGGLIASGGEPGLHKLLELRRKREYRRRDSTQQRLLSYHQSGMSGDPRRRLAPETAWSDNINMPLSFQPRLDILPKSQRELLAGPRCGASRLRAVWRHCARAPTRPSDIGRFRFFLLHRLRPNRLQSRLPFFRDLDPTVGEDVWVHYKRDNLEGHVQRPAGTVRIGFFGGMENLRRVEDPRRAVGSQVQVASLIDLAGMKLRVIQVRGSWKDYVDVHALVLHGIDIRMALAAARAIDARFQPEISLRALQFYGDGTLVHVPVEIQRDLTRWAQSVDLAKLPHLASQRGLTPGELSL